MIKTGWIMTALLAVFMAGASIAPKFLGMPAAGEALTALGWPADYLLLIGLLEMLATLLFVFPRTGPAGALLMTAILGGALASHLRVGSPLFSHTLFSVYLGVWMWLALWLRQPLLRSLLPLSSGKGGQNDDRND